MRIDKKTPIFAAVSEVRERAEQRFRSLLLEPDAPSSTHLVQRSGIGSGTSLFDVALDRLNPLAKKEAQAVLNTTLSPALFEHRFAESAAIVGRRVDLYGDFDFGSVEVKKSGNKITVAPSESAGYVFGGERYVELPNSTALTTTDPQTGKQRELVLTRGVRPYENSIDISTGTFNAPKGYVSDVLLFERVNGKLEYQSTLLRSDPESSFLFEDPRISTLYLADGSTRILLSGTDYSPHVPGSTDPDVMNRGVWLELDARGLPKEVALDAKTKRPAFIDLSPAPQREGDGYRFVDAKNGTLAMNEQGEIVLRSRMRLPPDHKYGEQVLKFPNLEALLSYDFSRAPNEMKTVATEATFKELYPAELSPVTPKRGFGPGTTPVRIERRGDSLFVSDGKFAPQKFAGKVPPDLSDSMPIIGSRAGKAVPPEDTSQSYPIADGAVVYLSFDHELRVLEDRRDDVVAPKRVYSSTLKLWNPELDRIELIYGDAVQPLMPHQRGGSGILDLHHTYPMGRVLVEEGDRTVVRVYAGAADAHTESYDFDLAALLAEMAEGSERRASGQVYRPEAQ